MGEMPRFANSSAGNQGGVLNGWVVPSDGGSYYLKELTYGIRSTITLTSTLKDRTPAAAEVPLAPSEKRWGKPSNFTQSVSAPSGWFRSSENTFTGPENEEEKEDPPPPGGVLLQFDEIQRTVKDVTIYNPSDHQQFVVVQRIQNIIFQAPDQLASTLQAVMTGQINSVQFKYVLKNQSEQ